MCMLFLCINPDPGPDGFYLILANTRDEFYFRPSRVCHFWEQNPSIIGGMDVSEDKQGGTWLAMNSGGQVASLLNLMRPVAQLDGTKRDRGFLAVNFLESGLDGPSYLHSLRREADFYNGFLLVTLDIKPMLGDITASYYSNLADDGPTVLKEGVHVFGNSAPSRPWRKVRAARAMFEGVTSAPTTHRKERLLADIFQLLRDDTLHYPDDQLDRDAEGHSEEDTKLMSAIFITPHNGLYGSRTHTVILVDAHGHVDYVERTMQEPINVESDITWVTTRKHFDIHDPSRIVSRL